MTGKKKRLNSKTVPQETVIAYLTSIPKPIFDKENCTLEERDSKKEGILARKALRINILTGKCTAVVEKDITS